MKPYSSHKRKHSSHQRNVGPVEVEAMSEDRISSLPDDIIHRIFSFMNMKNVVRTSVLSTRWRYLWTFSPNLDFSPDLINHRWTQYLSMLDIDRCLELYNALKLHSFKIHGLDSEHNYEEMIDRWIHFTRLHGVEELEISFTQSKKPRGFPLSIFGCRSLSQMKLSNGRLNLPENFLGLKCLVTIKLTQIVLKSEVVTTLVATCDLLENLEFRGCEFEEERVVISGPNLRLRKLVLQSFVANMVVEIDAPNLLYFEYKGYFSEQLRKNFPRLLKANISLFCIQPVLQDWTQLVTDISHVRCLLADDWLLVNFSDYYLQPMYQHIMFKNLKEFHGYITWVKTSYLVPLVNFLRACPNLEHLCFVFLIGDPKSWYIVEDRWESNWPMLSKEPTSSLNQLKTIKIIGFLGTKIQMQLVEYLLEKAISLETLSLIYSSKSEVNRRMLRNGIYRLRRAFPHVPISASQVSMDYVCQRRECMANAFFLY